MEAFVRAALLATAVYALLGALFGLWFVSAGHRRLDQAPMSVWGRIMIFPASAALWPLLLVRVLTVRVPLNAVDGGDIAP
ncbi:MAG: hypothetical protein AAF184_10810 [Pseudomonadota bacterium]